MTHPLGLWAVIDIETSGIDPMNDQIIDVGFLQFEGTELIRKYSSLVKYEGELSQFIQKLTGITSKMARKAPHWGEVEPEVQDLFGHSLLAHNADFEESFLSHHFKSVDDGSGRENYEDSLYYLSLLCPNRSSLKLDGFIHDWKIREGGEIHRGFEDSVDLLKVLLAATASIRIDRTHHLMIQTLFKKYALNDYWYAKFFSLSDEELEKIAKSIDFNLDEAVENVRAHANVLEEDIIDDVERSFPLEFNGQNIKSIYADEKKIQEKLPFFSYRKSQEDLSLRTGQSFKNKVHALVQAPTGTGKTLGYLLPASLFAHSEKQQVLVATGTKTLQHQAMTKDVPLLRKFIGMNEKDLKIRQLVGSNNHLCELLFRQSVEEEDLLAEAKTFEQRFVDMYFELVFFHNSRARSREQILRGDLPYIFKHKADGFTRKEKEIAVDFRSCTGSHCPFKGECSYINGLREAREADIIVGNHALMFSWPRAFPRPQYIVVDEAHKIEDETTKAFTVEISQDGLESLGRSLNHLQGVGSLFYLLAQTEEKEGSSSEVIARIREEVMSAYQMLQDHMVGLPDLIERYFKKMPRYTDTFWNELPMISKKGQNDALAVSIFNHLDSLRHIITEINKYLLPYVGMWDPKQFNEDNLVIAYTRFETFMGTLDDLQVGLEYALGHPEPKSDYTLSLKFHEKQGFSLQAAPVNVGRVLHDGLLEPTASVLFTSATLGNAHGDQGVRGIEWSTGYSYLEAERRFKTGFFLPPAYDYKNNTKVFLCDDTLPFYDHSFVLETLREVMKLIRDLKGRSLLLFSAKSRFEVAREVLLKEFEGEIPLFIQGMGNNVVEEFKNAGEGVLLGMESFGEGIDVPGEALQFVFIDKIPDIRMDLVIKDRRDFYESNLGNEFTDYYLAHRTRSLHQKLGRLLRTESDIGGVIIVDSRIKRWKGRTMEKLLKLMEPYEINRAPLKQACGEIRDFIFERN